MTPLKEAEGSSYFDLGPQIASKRLIFDLKLDSFLEKPGDE